MEINNRPPAIRTVFLFAFIFIFIILFSSLICIIFKTHFISSEVPLLQEEEVRECRAAEFDPLSDVIQLTESNFDDLVLSPQNTVWIVEL